VNSTDIALSGLVGLPLYNEVIKHWQPTRCWEQMMAVIDRLRTMEIKGHVYKNYDQFFNFISGYHKEPLNSLLRIGQAIVEMAEHYGLQEQARVHFKKMVVDIKNEVMDCPIPYDFEFEDVDPDEFRVKPVKEHLK